MFGRRAGAARSGALVAGCVAVAIALVPGTPASATDAGPVIKDASMYNGGYACSTRTAHPLHIGAFASELDVRAADADPAVEAFTFRFQIWPAADPSAVTSVVDRETFARREGHGIVPDDKLADATKYVWRVRVSDSNGKSAWSRSCVFRTDFTRPDSPDLTSPNFPSNQWGPAGVKAKFVVAPHDPDVVGFAYTWRSELAIPGCTSAGASQPLRCPDVFDLPDVVPASAAGPQTTFRLSPPGSGPNTLTVAAFDRVGDYSNPVHYDLLAPPSAPTIAIRGGAVCGSTGTFVFTPNDSVSGVVAYRYWLYGDDGPGTKVSARSDGTARISVPAGDLAQMRLEVESISSNGFTSTPNVDFVRVNQTPGVSSDVYVASGAPVGGVGKPGTFTFSPPADFPVAAYRYHFGPDSNQTVAADPSDSTAEVQWTPMQSGVQTLTVRAVESEFDGGAPSCPTTYTFDVAG